MRLLILVHGYPPSHTGGAERRAARTARHLKARGWDVMVLAIEGVSDSGEVGSWTESIEDGVRVRRLTLPADHSADAFRISYDNPQCAVATEAAIRDWRPDVVHLFSGYLMSSSAPRVSLAHEIPVVVSLTDYWWLCHRITLIRTNQTRCDGPTLAGCARCQAETKRRFRLPAKHAPALANTLWKAAGRHEAVGAALGLPVQHERRSTLIPLLNQCSALISPSAYLADFHVASGVDRRLMRVWRQGVDLDRCLPRSASPMLRFGCLGQVKHHKGVDLLLDAWRRVESDRPRHLAIYGSAEGEPEYGERIRAEIEGMDDANWPGAFRGNEVWKVLNGLDVLVIPSRWVENSPNSILEAQAVGLPVIGANLGAVPELVQHEVNGLVFALDDAQDLARQIQRLLDDPDLLGRLRANPIAFKSVDEEIDQLHRLYLEILTSPGKAPNAPPGPDQMEPNAARRPVSA